MGINNIYRNLGGPGDKKKKKTKPAPYTGISQENMTFELPTIPDIQPINKELQPIEIPEMPVYEPPTIDRKKYTHFAMGGPLENKLYGAYNPGDLEGTDLNAYNDAYNTHVQGVNSNIGNITSGVTAGATALMSGQPDTSIGKGVVTGAATGAQIGGSIVPGIGHAAGAVIGGVFGGVNAKNKQYAQERDQTAYSRESNSNRQQNMLYNNRSEVLTPEDQLSTGSNMQYAMGGPMQGTPSTQQDTLNEFKGGGTHEQNPLGGIPMGNGQSVEEGETEFTPENYVFSDRILINKNLQEEYGLPKSVIGKSFADYSKKINKKYSFRENDKLDNDSKKRELALLMDAQESFKKVEMPQTTQVSTNQPAIQPQQSKMDPMMMQQQAGAVQNIPQMAMGGYRYQDSYQKAYGDPPYIQGGTNDVWNQPSNIQTYDQTYNKSYNKSAYNINPNLPVNNFKMDDLPGSQIPIQSNPYDYTQVGNNNTGLQNSTLDSVIPAQTETGQPLLKGIEKVGAFAPMAYNLWQGSQSAHQINPNEFYVSPEKLRAAKLNVNPILRKNNETFNAQRNAIASASGGNAGSYLSNIAQAQLNKQKSDADTLIHKENYDNQQRVGADQFNIGNQLNADMSNIANKYQITHDNLRANAQKDHHIGAATLQAQQIANLYAQNRFTKATAEQLVKEGKYENIEEAFLGMAQQQINNNNNKGQ